MPKSSQATISPTGNPAFVCVARGFLLIAAGLAAYLAWTSLSAGSPVGCGLDSNCHKVLQSRWAYWFGLPVSLPGLLLYLTVFGATFRLDISSSSGKPSRANHIVALGSMLILLAAFWFILLQLVAIRSLCSYCLATHATASAAALILLSLSRGFVLRAPKRTPGTSRLSSPALWRVLAAAFVGLLVLAAGQFVLAPKTYIVESTSTTSHLSAKSTHIIGTNAAVLTQTNAPAPPRMISLHDGKFQLNPLELPMIGSPTASNIVVSLFDYTCHHCRDMHPILVETQKHFGDRLAFLNLPMPLDSNCNPLVKRTPTAHQRACEYARIGLAVWRVDRKAFAEFDHWIFSQTSTPSFETVRHHAEQLIGKAPLEASLNDPWITQQISQDVAIFETNYRASGRSQMPQLMIGSKIFAGIVKNAEALLPILQAPLNL
jgi:uncharacterized membrane protein